MARHEEEEESGGNHERWLLTYSDMITLLLVLFIVMYTMSTIDAKKFEQMAQQLSGAFNATTSADSTGAGGNGENGTGGAISVSSNTSSLSSSLSPEPTSDFKNIYELIKENLKNNGLQDEVDIEKGDNYILLRFKDTVLFYPDSSTMKSGGNIVLNSISEILLKTKNNIQHIQIDGHTANVGVEKKNDTFSWQLSSDRAIAVLKYLSQSCNLDQSKMSIAGYSHFVPIDNNDTEAGRAKNRRVEIKITKVSS